MFSDTLSINDGAVARSYALVSRESMNSARRETTAGTPSVAGSFVTIKHTLDAKAITKPNRHLVQFTYTEVNATTGEAMPITVHAVVTRHKGCTDAQVKKQIVMLANLLLSANFADQLMIGAN